jgi:uncharacterized membrane protein
VPLLEASVLIARPVGEVWEYVTSAENLPVCVPVLHEVTKITDGPVRVGTQWQGTMRFLGIGFTGLVEFTQCELNNAAEFKSVEGKFRFSCTITFQEVDGRTRFTRPRAVSTEYLANSPARSSPMRPEERFAQA